MEAASLPLMADSIKGIGAAPLSVAVDGISPAHAMSTATIAPTQRTTRHIGASLSGPRSVPPTGARSAIFLTLAAPSSGDPATIGQAATLLEFRAAGATCQR